MGELAILYIIIIAGVVYKTIEKRIDNRKKF